jgi:hypothetical protein
LSEGESKVELDYDIDDKNGVGINLADVEECGNLKFKLNDDIKLENNLNKGHRILKESCNKCCAIVNDFQKKIDEVKKQCFTENNITKNTQKQKIFLILEIQNETLFKLENPNETFETFEDLYLFLEKNKLIPKFSTLLRIQDILKNEESIMIEIGIRFRIAGDHPVEDKLAGRTGGICVRCTIRDKPDAYLISRQHSISPTVCDPVIPAANSYPIRSLKRSFSNNDDLMNFYRNHPKKLKLDDCKNQFPKFEHQKSLPIILVEMIEYALRDFHDMLNEGKYIQSILR